MQAKTILALLLLGALVLPAQALLIDDFHDGFSTVEVPLMTPDADGSLRSSTAASVPGGMRSLGLQPLAGSSALSFIAVEDRGRRLDAMRLGTQQLYVSWGYGQGAPMNLDLSGQAALRLELEWFGAQTLAGPWDARALSLTVYATTSNGVGLNPNGSALSAVLSPTTGAWLDLPLASFSTNASTGLPVNWADVYSLLFVVSETGVPAGLAGFGVHAVSTVAVPEPASAVLALGGLMGLWGLSGLAGLKDRLARSRRGGFGRIAGHGLIVSIRGLRSLRRHFVARWPG
jgi:hypothetical protein